MSARPARGLVSAVVAVLAAAATLAAFAEERITGFDADITVHTDGSMSVTERIEVVAEQRQIKRGIYRDFPTRYKDRQGRDYVVDFDVISVRRDNVDEPYHTRDQANGVRVYIGDKDVFLEPGHYRYELSYRTDRQLGHFGDRDELYWNVTGNGWAFPIEQASATVRLPEGISGLMLEWSAYTGRQSQRGRDYDVSAHERGLPVFRTTRRLAPGEGLTIAVGWPAGFVERPGRAQRMGYLLRDNAIAVVGVVALLVLLAYYLVVWDRFGRDPAAGVVIPRFEPPRGLSPAAVRYIRRMGFDHKGFAAAVINMAVKGYFDIDEDVKEFTLRRRDDADPSRLSPGERKLANRLLGAGNVLTLRKQNHRLISGAVDALKRYFDAEYHTVYFRRNSGLLLPGIMWAILVVIGVALLSGSLSPPVIFSTAWVAMWSAAVFFMWMRRQFVMAIIFTVIEIVAIATAMFDLISPRIMVLLLALVGVNLLFYYLLRAPTRLGRRTMDEIEGFRRYLEVAEENRLNVLNPPERTPELFERYLPYALALGVDQQWSDKFAGVLARAAREPEGYRPRWYRGSSWRGASAPRFASALGSSLTSAISSSSVAPGSSSGVGGGGSSGGGGGGGGGGGW